MISHVGEQKSRRHAKDEELVKLGRTVGMAIRLNDPGSLGNNSATHAGHFLLFKGPLGQLDLVRKQITVHVGVDQLELGVEGMQVLARLFVLALHNLDAPLVVGIAWESRIAVSADLEMILVLSHWRLVVVRVKALAGCGMHESDNVAVLNVLEVLGDCAISLLDNPVVVAVLVGVKSDLLLYYDKMPIIELSC